MIEIINCVLTRTVIVRAPARTPMAAIFCIFVYAVNVLKILQKKKSDTDHVNNKWMKYWVASSDIGLINFSGTMRFFCYSELVNSLHLFYSCRKNLFTKL